MCPSGRIMSKQFQNSRMHLNANPKPPEREENLKPRTSPIRGKHAEHRPSPRRHLAAILRPPNDPQKFKTRGKHAEDCPSPRKHLAVPRKTLNHFHLTLLMKCNQTIYSKKRIIQNTEHKCIQENNDLHSTIRMTIFQNSNKIKTSKGKA